MQIVEDFVKKLSEVVPVQPQVERLQMGLYRIAALDKPSIYFYTRGHTNPFSQEEVIHIQATVWKRKEQVILNRIQVAWGYCQRIYARQTTCKRVIRPVALEFQEENHMLVALSGKFRFGLYFNEELVSLAVFSGIRKMNRENPYTSIEMIRFCHKGNRLVVGGVSKLIATMNRELKPDDVMTYVDQNWSNGKKFEQIGFKIVGEYRGPNKGVYSLKLIRKN